MGVVLLSGFELATHSFAEYLDLHRLAAEHALQLMDATFELLHFRIADNRLVRIHRCSTTLAQEPAPPVK